MDKMNEMQMAVYLYGGKTAIITLIKKEPIGIIIDNSEIFNSHKVLFDILWNASRS